MLATLGCGGDDLLLPAKAGPQLTMMQGDRQVGQAGARLPDSLLVQVVDTLGHGVSAQPVTWDVSIGGGTVTPAVDTSDTNGYASTQWALGPVPGANAVRAMLSDGASITFTAVGNSDTGQGGGGGAPTTGSHVDHFVFRLQPPHDLKVGERFRIEAALADSEGNVVPLMGILMYIGLFPVGSDVPNNHLLQGNRFVATDSGVAVFDDLAITRKGHYRFRVLSDQLPELGPHGPEPYLFSLPFQVR